MPAGAPILKRIGRARISNVEPLRLLARQAAAHGSLDRLPGDRLLGDCVVEDRPVQGVVPALAALAIEELVGHPFTAAMIEAATMIQPSASTVNRARRHQRRAAPVADAGKRAWRGERRRAGMSMLSARLSGMMVADMLFSVAARIIGGGTGSDQPDATRDNPTKVAVANGEPLDVAGDLTGRAPRCAGDV